MARQRGFTYGEMIVIVSLLLLLVASAVLNLKPLSRNSDIRMFKSKLLSMAEEARTRAKDTGTTVSLMFDKNAKVVSSVAEGTDGHQMEIAHLELPDGVVATQFSADQDESSADGWRVPIYPDGTSAGGGIELEIDEKVYSFSVQRSDGVASLVEGPLPDLSSDQWKVGDYERRS